MKSLLASWFCGVCLCATLQSAPQDQGFVLLASTIGPIDSGIVDVLEAAFEKDTGIRVRHVGVGTGAALDMARRGGVDLLLVHARKLEEKFIADGFGTERIPFMYNDFVIVGPTSDPAGIKGMKSASNALRAIAAKAAPFITRGDKSGTHVAELELWTQAGLAPAAPWYTVFEKGSEGNVQTLLHTDQKAAYTVIDRATYLAVKDRIHLGILVESDEALLNHISLIPVNPAKFPHTNAREATRFSQWLTAPDKGQGIIRTFGKETYGAPLFVPEARSKTGITNP